MDTEYKIQVFCYENIFFVQEIFAQNYIYNP